MSKNWLHRSGRAAIAGGPLLALAATFWLAHPPAGAQMQFIGMPDPAAEANIDYIMSAPRLPVLSDECPPCLSGPKVPFGRLSGKLSLTDEQAQKLYDIQKKYQTQMSDLLSDYNTCVRDLQDMLTDPQAGADRLRDMGSKLNEKRAAIATLSLNEEIDSLAVLTPEQKQGLRSLLAKDRQRKHHFW